MPDVPEQENHDGLIEHLLALPDANSRASLLRQHHLLNPESLNGLLDTADDLLGSDPGKARRLAELCMELAEPAEAPAAVPKACYVIAGAYDLNGDFERALELTQQAHDGYEELGMELEALRTDVGKMSALLDLGQYQEVLDIGANLLKHVAGLRATGLGGDRRKVDLLEAVVHQNRGLCYEFVGQYTEALDAYVLSETLYRDLEMFERLSEVSCNRGIMLLNVGRSREALEVFENAARLFKHSRQDISYAGVLINLGHAHIRLEDYVSGFKALEEARVVLEPLDAQAGKQKLLMDTADAYLALNLYSESLDMYRKVLALTSIHLTSHERAWTFWGAGIALRQEGIFDEAEEYLLQAEALFSGSDNVPLLSSVMLERAALLESLGERNEAVEISVAALTLATVTDEWPLQRIYCSLTIAELSLPDTVVAEHHLQNVEDLLDEMSLPHLRYRFDECLGHVRFIQRRYEEAFRLYEKAAGEIEKLRGTLTQDLMRTSFLKSKTSVYKRLLTLHLETAKNDTGDDLLRSLDAAERAKSRTLADLLTRDAPATAPADSDTRKRLEELRSELSAIYTRLLDGVPEHEEGRSPVSDLHDRSMLLEGEISKLKLETSVLNAEGSALFEAPAVRGSLLERLPSKLLLCAYHILDDEVLAFVVFDKRIRVVRNVGSVTKVRELLRKLDSQWDRLRSGQTLSERQMGMIERSTQRILAGLYDEVFRPVEPLIEEAIKKLDLNDGEVPELTIVPHGSLHQAPFHAFFDGEEYLLDRFEVSYAPSASVFVLCQEKERRTLERAVAVGVSDDLIPTVGDEAAMVARLFPDSESLIDERATPEALEEVIGGCGVLHLACHGMFRSDNPMFSALKLHERWLLAHDAMGLDLDGALVVLSACESGRNVVVGGDEILGLTRAFLGARAATLLVSLWIVQDDTTPDLMRHFYERLISGDPPATALRTAQLETRKTHPHPYYWAPFVTVGKR